MIKLIKAGVRNFRMTCSTCEAQYTYDIHDLGTPTNNSFVKCPCCGMTNYHYQRDKFEEEDETTSCDGCVYQYEDGSTNTIGYCVCCRRNNDLAKNDYYTKK